MIVERRDGAPFPYVATQQTNGTYPAVGMGDTHTEAIGRCLGHLSL